MTMTEQRLLRFQLIGMLSMVLLITLGLGSYFSIQQLRSFQAESLELERNEEHERRMVLANLRNSSLAQINHLIRSQAQLREDALRQQVDQALVLARTLLANDHPQPGTVLVERQIIEALRAQRFFNGRGYFFIIDRNGICRLNAGHPEMEGRDISELTDPNGKKMVREMLDTAFGKAGSGFVRYHWNLPEPSVGSDEKLAFVRAFTPLGWLIGTGEYLTHTGLRVQEQALLQLGDSQTANSGDSFLTILDDQQHVLLASGNPALTGQRVETSIAETLAGALREDGYLSGQWPQLGDPARPEQLLQVTHIPEWGWTLVNGLYLDSHSDNRLRREALLTEHRSELLRTTLTALVLAPVLALLLALLFNHAVARRFRLYRESLAASQNRLRQYAETDPLTGLPNRQRLADRLGHAILQAQASDSMLAVLCVDLDHFKHINDSLGHAVGDQLLLSVSMQLRNVLRPADTLSRGGGDEFTILLENIESADQAAAIADRLLRTGSHLHLIEEQELTASLSIGIALYPLDGSDIQSLLKNADAALYHAKDCGRNNYQFFTSALNERVQEQLQLESRLRLALQRNEFALHYQPKYDLHSGRLSGCEALLRWHSPQLGEVPPSRFIPVAEHCGLIGNIGDWVLQEACRQIASWMAGGVPLVPVAVNVSAWQFSHGDLASQIDRLLTEHDIPPQLLELELTESVLAEDYSQVSQTLRRLKQQGISLSMDDFGTGFSSLSYLSHFQLDTLKIDRAFIRELPHSGEHSALTEAIIAMARALGMHCVAEGIETREQLEFLRQRGCDTGQGFLLSSPLTACELQQLLLEGLPAPA